MIYLIDLFCGAGGFSCGAKQAGAIVFLAVDCWLPALEVHKHHHPESHHWCMELGHDEMVLAQSIHTLIKTLPSDSKIHVHASPPCQSLSTANGSIRQEDRYKGLVLIEWTLRLVNILIPIIDSWTMEEVNVPLVRTLFERHNGSLMICCNYGVPSTRKRLFCGNIIWTNVAEDICIKTLYDTLLDHGYTEEVLSKLKQTTSKTAKTLKSLAYTVTSHDPKLLDLSTNKQVSPNMDVLCCIQTFPQGYFECTKSKQDRRKMIANAVPPRLARAIIASIV